MADALDRLRTFPDYLTTPAEDELRQFLAADPGAIDDAVLAEIGAIFVELWRRRPRDKYWYGDLRQSFVPHDLQQRLATVPAVRDQLLADFRDLARAQRTTATEIGCRRLERAAELLLHAPGDDCGDVLVPIIKLDRIDRQRTQPLSVKYEAVYWGMVRIVRKLGIDL